MKISEKIVSLSWLSPILFSSSYVLVLFYHNIRELTLSRVFIPTLFIFVFSILNFLLFQLVFKNQHKSAIFSSIVSVFFFSYSDLLSLIKNSHLVIFIIFALLIITIILINRTKKQLISLSLYVTLMAGFAFFIPLLGIVRYEISRRMQIRPQNPLLLSKINTFHIQKNNRPDIYFILPDSYTSTENLKKYFNYDNSSFVNFLENKGFYVASDSSSNYPKTFLSLTSTFNMEYLDNLSIYKNSDDQTFTDRMIEDNNVLKFLKGLGYRYYQMGSWWGSTHYSRLADGNFIIENSRLGDIGEFNYMILNSSILNPIISYLYPEAGIGESDNDKRTRVLYQFEELPKIAKLPGPKFVFTHIISPHGPYVFDKNCEYTSYGQNSGNGEILNYTNQLNCINQKLEIAIDEIIKNSDSPPVILLQSDEGPNFVNGNLNPSDNWRSATSDKIREKFPILSAFLVPGMPKSSLYSSITPVNSFREIFNYYFSTNLPILPDKNFVFPDMNHLYEFIDVTSKLK